MERTTRKTPSLNLWQEKDSKGLAANFKTLLSLSLEGYKSKKERDAALLLFTVAAAVVIYVFYHSIIMLGLSLPVGIVLSNIYGKSLIEKRRNMMRLEFKDFLFSLASSFSAGRQMTEAIEEGIENLKLIYEEDCPLIAELTPVVNQIKTARMSEREALMHFANHCEIEEIKNFFDVYVSSMSTGADVINVINRASGVLMDKMEIEEEIRSMSAQKRFEARLISIMPLVIIVGLNIVSPDYLEPLYGSLAGAMIMSICLTMIAFGYYEMMKLTDISV